MKMVAAVIKPFKLDDVREALEEAAQRIGQWLVRQRETSAAPA